MAEIKYTDTLLPNGENDVALSLLVGKKITEVIGYFSDIGAGATFKLHQIIFDDGSKVGVEGEHDFPYVVTWDDQPNLDEDTLERLMAEQEASY